MAKLVATYTEGFFAVFTENRSGMQQRALIDIGDKVPTPKEMAELAGVLSDQWGWGNVIERAPSSKAIDEPKRTRDDSDPKPVDRQAMILAFLAKHPESGNREIVSGCGFEPTHARVSRWAFTMSTMLQANLVIARKITERGERGTINRLLYSLP